MSRYLITGANGFLGINLVQKLIKLSEEVAVVIRRTSVSSPLHRFSNKVKFFYVSEYSLTELEAVIDNYKPEFVIHAASACAKNPWSKWGSTITDEISMTFNLVNSIMNSSVKRLLTVGSGLEYSLIDSSPKDEGNPPNPSTFYGLNKSLSWDVARYYSQQSSFEVVHGRIFTAFGPMDRCDRLIPFLIDNLVQGNVINLKNENNILDYLYIDDVVDALLLMSRKANPGEVYNICSGEGSKVQSIYHSIQKILERTCSTSQPPINVSKGNQNEDENFVFVGDNHKLMALGWKQQIGMFEGLEKTVDWFISGNNFLDGNRMS